MSEQTNGAPPSTARALATPAAQTLAELAGLFDDLQFVLRGCERLLTELEQDKVDDLVIESVWTATLSAYARCFRTGAHGTGLSVTDFTELGVEGEVVKWHSLLGKLRDFYVQDVANPREVFSVGVAQDPAGAAEGIVLTSLARPAVDEQTVRQTGRLAYELSRLVDGKIKEQQRAVFLAVADTSADELNKLPPIELGLPAG
jgi:hypothetical protein